MYNTTLSEGNIIMLIRKRVVSVRVTFLLTITFDK